MRNQPPCHRQLLINPAASCCKREEGMRREKGSALAAAMYGAGHALLGSYHSSILDGWYRWLG